MIGTPSHAASPTAGFPPPPEASDGRFLWPIRVYWEDTDAGGIVFYANYLKFFERARTEWLRHLGLEQQALREHTGGMFVVGETQLRYMKPARLDDTLWVSARLQEIGRVSLTLTQTVCLVRTAAPPTILCEGSIRIGWVDAATLRPQRLPRDLVQALRGASTSFMPSLSSEQP